jgi:hypothetical protein
VISRKAAMVLATDWRREGDTGDPNTLKRHGRKLRAYLATTAMPASTSAADSGQPS